MTKRRAEDALFGGAPSKTCYGSTCGPDVMHLKGPVDPPSLQALLGSRCRKRAHSSEEEDLCVHESRLHRSPAADDAGSHALNGRAPAEGSGGRPTSPPTQKTAKKRARDDDDDDDDEDVKMMMMKTFPKVAKVSGHRVTTTQQHNTSKRCVLLHTEAGVMAGVVRWVSLLSRGCGGDGV